MKVSACEHGKVWCAHLAVDAEEVGAGQPVGGGLAAQRALPSIAVADRYPLLLLLLLLCAGGLQGGVVAGHLQPPQLGQEECGVALLLALLLRLSCQLLIVQPLLSAELDCHLAHLPAQRPRKIMF